MLSETGRITDREIDKCCARECSSTIARARPRVPLLKRAQAAQACPMIPVRAFSSRQDSQTSSSRIPAISHGRAQHYTGNTGTTLHEHARAEMRPILENSSELGPFLYPVTSFHHLTNCIASSFLATLPRSSPTLPPTRLAHRIPIPLHLAVASLPVSNYRFPSRAIIFPLAEFHS